MLGKLIKHEFKATYKTFIILYAAALLISFFTMLSYRLGMSGNIILISIQSLLTVGFFLACIALPVGAIIYTIYRFYKNLFTDEGYLTFTLPVSRLAIVLSKFIVSCFWFTLSIFMDYVSIHIFLLGDDSLKETYDFLSNIFSSTLVSSNGKHVLIGFFIVYAIGYITYTVSFIYMALAFGQFIIPNHKIIGAILAYFVLNLAQQLISTVILLIYLGAAGYSLTSSAFPPSYYLVLGIVDLLMTALWLFLTTLICKRKLNLS